VLKYQEKMDREDFKKGVWGYIMDEKKDVVKLMEYAKERKVLKKVQNMVGVWL
jgi:RNase P/RNase MRP subunit p29